MIEAKCLELMHFVVGGCTHPLTCRGSTISPSRYSLFPRLWLPTHDDPTLPGQRACQTAASSTIPGKDYPRQAQAY